VRLGRSQRSASPWQNDRTNGTVRYLDAPFEGEELLELIELCEVVALAP